MDRNIYLLGEATATLTGQPEQCRARAKTFHAIGRTSSGTGSATILVEVSNDKKLWLTAGTITLDLSTTDSSDGFGMNAPWVWTRGTLSSISGTGATVSLIMGL